MQLLQEGVYNESCERYYQQYGEQDQNQKPEKLSDTHANLRATAWENRNHGRKHRPEISAQQKRRPEIGPSRVGVSSVDAGLPLKPGRALCLKASKEVCHETKHQVSN